MSAPKPRVSAIVPIYNVEDYLAECLDSILAQTLGDIEVICVNDGSTDGSLEIIRRFEAQDGRIRVIDKPNGGYGHSVNTGLDAARGEWISIVEPDDFVAPAMYEDLLANAYLEDGGVPDIVKASFWVYYDGADGDEPHVEVPFLAKCMPTHRCELSALKNPDLVRQHPSIWSAIYRADFLHENGIRMIEPKGAGWADNPWLYDTMLRARHVVWVPSACYHYRKTNPGSSSNLMDYRLPFDRLRDIRRIYDELNVRDRRLKTALASRTLTYVVRSVLDSGGFDESDPELQGLIREALEPLDGKALLARDSMVFAEGKDYYRDFMGLKVAAVKRRTKRQHPLFSIVIALKDDRAGLWQTLDSVLAQRLADIEVICVDCATRDRGAVIARDVSARDGRFTVVHEPSGSVGNGFARGAALASGDYVVFMRPGVTFGRADYLSRVRQVVRKGSEVKKAGMAQANASQSGMAQANALQPGMVQAGMAQANASQSGVAQANASQPGMAQANASQYGAMQPGMAQVGMAQANASQPGASQPGMAQASMAQVGTPQPDATQPDAPQPSTPQSGATQPGALQPGVSQPDVVVTEPDFKWARSCRMDKEPRMRMLDCAARPELFASNVEPAVYGKCYRRAFLSELLGKAAFEERGDEDGRAFNVASLAQAGSICLLGGCAVNTAKREELYAKRSREEADLQDALVATYDAMMHAGERLSDEAGRALAQAKVNRTDAQDGVAHALEQAETDRPLAQCAAPSQSEPGCADARSATAHTVGQVELPHEAEQAEAARSVAQGAILHALAHDLRAYSFDKDGKVVYDALSGVFAEGHGIAQRQASRWENQKDFRFLHTSFERGYDAFVQASKKEADERAAALEKRVKVLESTAGYQSERALKTIAKRILKK